MLAKYFAIIRNYVLSVSSQIKCNFYHQNTFLDVFRTNSRTTIGRNPSMVIPLLANKDLTPMLVTPLLREKHPLINNNVVISSHKYYVAVIIFIIFYAH